MQAFTEEQLIHVLQLTQGKRRGEKPEGYGRLIKAAFDGFGGTLDHGALPGSQGRELRNLEPCVARTGRRGLVRDQPEIGHRYIGIARVPLSIAKRADLFEPCWRFAERLFRGSGGSGVEAPLTEIIPLIFP